MTKPADDYQWWQTGMIYQIYPRSFYDSNGDGVGDLRGILKKLDYLKWLGIDCIWISPIYPSPMHDFGYDISDYKDIYHVFGNMDDFDELLEACHQKGLKLVLDLVPNHTSNEHPWFLESKSSESNHKRDWYIWKAPGKGGATPNNWISEFGGPAWEYDETTDKYYYHTFLKEQPDLNWRNGEVQEAMWDVMQFWFDKGIDGFRIDVLWYLVKDDLFRDNPPNPSWHEGMPDHDRLLPAFSNDQPYVHQLVAKMRNVSDGYDDKVLIGEIYLPFNKLISYYNKGKGVHLPFNFSLILSEWKAPVIYSLVADYEGALAKGDWPNWVMGNHDQPRLKARIGENQIRNAAILLLTLRGTPTMYYGDEIGMDNVRVPKDHLQDPRAILEPDINVGRDPERTPMQWSKEDHAGFSTIEPWLPVGSDYKTTNVQTEQGDEKSLLWLYKRLIELRKKELALQLGDYIPAGIKNGVMAYIRKYHNDRFLIVLNFGKKKEEFIPDFSFKGTISIGTNREKEGQEVVNKVLIDGNEGMVVALY